MPLNHRDFWDTKRLKSELATHAMSEGKVFLYFLAILGFDWLQFTVIRLSSYGRPITDWERADALIALAITIAGVLFLFARNGGSRGRDFLYRYFPLSVVVGWKFVAVGFVVLALSHRLMQGAPAHVSGWAATGILVAVNIGMFLRIGKHMKDLAREPAA